MGEYGRLASLPGPKEGARLGGAVACLWRVVDDALLSRSARKGSWVRVLRLNPPDLG